MKKFNTIITNDHGEVVELTGEWSEDTGTLAVYGCREHIGDFYNLTTAEAATEQFQMFADTGCIPDSWLDD